MTDKKVSEIVEKFEGVSTQAFEWSVRQQYHEAGVLLTVAFTLLFISGCLTRYLYNTEWSEGLNDDGIDPDLYIIFAILCFVVGMMLLFPGILHLMNIKYYALQALIG